MDPKLQDVRRRAKESYDISGPSAQVAELLQPYVAVVTDDAHAWFQYGDSLRKIGRFREAEKALLTARDLAPKEHRFVIYARLGMLASNRDTPDRAERWFRLATSDSQCPGWVWCLRGANLMRMESIRLAIDCLNTALKLPEVDREEVLLNLALTARYLREYDKANDLAIEALKTDQNYAAAKELLTSLEGAKEVQDELRR